MSCALRKHSYSGMSSCSQSLLFCLHWSVFKATRGLKNNPMHSPHTICGITPKACVMSWCFFCNKQTVLCKFMHPCWHVINHCRVELLFMLIVAALSFHSCQWSFQLIQFYHFKKMFFRTHHHHVKETGQRATSRALPRGTEYFFICALKESFKLENKNCHY